MFYAAFGRPSESIESWLDQWNFFLAGLADWDAAQAVDEEPPQSTGPSLFSTVLGQSWGGNRPTKKALDALACATGREDRCRDIMEANLLSDVPSVQSTDIYGTARSGIRGYVDPAVRTRMFGLETAHFLSDVVRQIGRERFEEFWTSDLPVDRAFATVVGKDIGEWTSDWLAARVGRQRFGPGVRTSELLVVILFAGIGALAGVGVRRR